MYECKNKAITDKLQEAGMYCNFLGIMFACLLPTVIKVNETNDKTPSEREMEIYDFECVKEETLTLYSANFICFNSFIDPQLFVG